MMQKEINKKKIVIIGAGVSGLSTGIYALRNGFEAEIYEKNDRAGGMCIAWKRKGFSIDGCIHWLTGTKDNTDLNRIWKDTGVIKDNEEIINHSDAGVFEYEGEKLTLYCDIDKLEEELLRVSPEDKKPIKRFIKDLINVFNMPLPLHEPLNTMNFFSFLKTGIMLLPYLPFYLGRGRKTCEQYAKKFKSPVIRYMINEYQPGPGNTYAFIYSLATMIFQNGGIPKGGSQKMTDNMVEEFIKLGGKLHLNSSVKNIIIEKKVAKGILLDNGEQVFADYIVSAVDAKFMLDNLLNKQFKNKALDNRYKNVKTNPSPSCFCCYFAIDKSLITSINESHQIFFPISPIMVGTRKISGIKLRQYSYDNTFDFKNKTVVEVLLEQYNWDYEFWVNLYKNKEKYNEEKTKICNEVISTICKQFPILKESDFSILDSFSPLTLTRYTNTYMGSFMSFMMTKRSKILMHKGTIKGVKNLYFASQWSQSPGGLPLAAAVGKFSIQRILKKEKRNHKITPRLRYKFQR